MKDIREERDRKMKKILCISGGGVKLVYFVSLLREIMRLYEEKEGKKIDVN